jgi:hypothetical protein
MTRAGEGRDIVPAGPSAAADAARPDPAHSRPAGMCAGIGHLIVYGNPAFVAAYGPHAVGMPAREAMLDVPAEGFEVLDAVYRAGRPLARWIRRDGAEWRLTATPRRDPGTGLVYGVGFHLRARGDVPVLIHSDHDGRADLEGKPS